MGAAALPSVSIDDPYAALGITGYFIALGAGFLSLWLLEVVGCVPLDTWAARQIVCHWTPHSEPRPLPWQQRDWP